MTKTYETTEMINRLQDMANQILSPGSEGKKFFEAVAGRLYELRAEADRKWLVRSKDAPPPSSAFMNPPTESNESSDKLWKKTSTEAAQQLRDLVNDLSDEITMLIAKRLAHLQREPYTVTQAGIPATDCPPVDNAHVETGCEQFKPQSYKPIPHHTGGEFHV